MGMILYLVLILRALPPSPLEDVISHASTHCPTAEEMRR